MSTQATQQLRQIADSETFSAVTKFLGQKKVEAVFSVRRDARGARYEKKALFDFSQVSEEQLYLLAMYACKVKLQAILRNLSQDVMLNSNTLAVINVKADLLEAPERAAGDPATQAVKSIMRATGLPEDAAKAVLDQAKTKAEGQKPKASAIKTMLKAS